MRTSAAGNKSAQPQRPAAHTQRGFTLLELLLVLTLVLLATAGVSLALRDGPHLRLQRDAERLMAMLDAARAQSQATGVPVRWRSVAQGFRFEGLVEPALASQSSDTLAATQRWLDPDTQVQDPDLVLMLGPEPVLPPQSLWLQSHARPGLALRLASDGLRPFSLQAAP